MICISIGSNDYDFCNKVVENNEFVEIRLDLCDFSEIQYRELFTKSNKSLATYIKNQIEVESTEFNLLINAIDYGANFIDINYFWKRDVTERLIQYAKSKKVKIICSYHNYECTPSKKELLYIIDIINSYDIDFIKIASKVNTNSDAARLISLYDSNFINLIVVGMGELGKIVRIASLKLGAPFTYASIDDSHQTAPSQLNINELSTIIKLI